MKTVLLGYEIGSGKPVEIPVLHTAVCGQTQQSGKTTTLEALIQRSGLRAVTFITKRAEGAFENARRIPAYFRERADWEFVSALLEATLRERMKFERSWIMRVCKGASTLKEVQKNVDEALRDARRGIDESVYMTLQAYLAKVVPEIERLPYSTRLQLEPGVNAIDISEYSSEVQSLVIRSVMEWVYDRERDTIVLIPEAWEFVPQKRNSPVKLAAIELIRKGAAAGNYVWLDSQDLAGVDKEILKQVSVWILGVQREQNEVKRTLSHLPAGTARPKLEEIMTLGRGEFFVSHGRELRCVYVQPAWMSVEKAQAYAKYDMPESYIARPATPKTRRTKGTAPETKPPVHKASSITHTTEDEVIAQKAIDRLGEFLNQEMGARFGPGYAYDNAVDLAIDFLSELKQLRKKTTDTSDDAIVSAVLERLKASPEFIALQVSAEQQELNVTVQRKVIDVDGSTLRGRLAQMVAEGWFTEAKTGNAAHNELQRRGFGTAKPNVYRELDGLTKWGFLTKEGDAGYRAVEGMKVNIREVEAA